VRIRRITVTPVAFHDPALLNAVGVHEPYALRSVVQLHCEGPEGAVVGLGESYGDDAFLELLRAAADAVIGLDVFHLGRIEQAVAAALGGGAFADRHGLTGAGSSSKTLLSVFGAFEVACLDAQGRTVGRSVADLLGGHLGISLAAMVQVAAATPQLDYACDTHWPWKRADEDVVRPGALRFVDGAVPLPPGPGLGVELDPDGLARLHELYLRCGLRHSDDTGYRQRLEPGSRPHRPGR
jgi:L-alanine-DL-glutamate epimerase-like enolase superfamily enzyme